MAPSELPLTRPAPAAVLAEDFPTMQSYDGLVLVPEAEGDIGDPAVLVSEPVFPSPSAENVTPHLSPDTTTSVYVPPPPTPPVFAKPHLTDPTEQSNLLASPSDLPSESDLFADVGMRSSSDSLLGIGPGEAMPAARSPAPESPVSDGPVSESPASLSPVPTCVPGRVSGPPAWLEPRRGSDIGSIIDAQQNAQPGSTTPVDSSAKSATADGCDTGGEDAAEAGEGQLGRIAEDEPTVEIRGSKLHINGKQVTHRRHSEEFPPPKVSTPHEPDDEVFDTPRTAVVREAPLAGPAQADTEPAEGTAAEGTAAEGTIRGVERQAEPTLSRALPQGTAATLDRHSGGYTSFDSFGLKPELVRACVEAGFQRPTEIQRRLIPLALAGRDVLGQSKTGSGKTASFLLPILHKLEPARPVVQALILVPTRELALQVNEECRRLSRFAPVRSLPVFGGRRMRSQLDELKRNPRLVVGTPGRILDHISRGTLRFDGVEFVVLDEVDRMLDIGFRDDIRQILRSITHPHQTLFVSATISEEIARLAMQFMHKPEEVYLAPDDLTVDKIEQYYSSVERHDKYRLLKKILAEEKPGRVIIFAATKKMADLLADKMTRDGLSAIEIHGDLQQSQREKVIARFRKGDIRVLVATDLASRGLDIPEVTHIINYDIPADPESYVHRIGRTARMGASGRAITFVSKEEGAQLTEIEQSINREIRPLQFTDFTPTAPPSVPVVAPANTTAPLSPMGRFQQMVHVPEDLNQFPFQQLPARQHGSGAKVLIAPAKNLGSRFPPARRRRRAPRR